MIDQTAVTLRTLSVGGVVVRDGEVPGCQVGLYKGFGTGMWGLERERISGSDHHKVIAALRFRLHLYLST